MNHKSLFRKIVSVRRTLWVGLLQMRKNIRYLFAGLFLFPLAIAAQPNYIVNSNADANAINLVTGDAGGFITLRSAIQAANTQPGAHIITFSGAVVSPISISLGQIVVGNAAVGNSITVNGPGMSSLTVNQTTGDQIFFTGSGAITFNLQNITLNYTGPAVAYSGGGGAIIAGGAGASTTLTNVTITNFNQQLGNGGAISQSSSLNNHSLTITNCIFTNNRCGGGGGAVSFNSQGGTATITGCTFTNNHTGVVGANTGGDGGAINLSGGGSGGTYLVEKNTFLNNQVENVTGHAGAIMSTNGTATIRYNRFIGNTCLNVAFPPLANIVGQAGGATTHVTIADNNWWGVNTGPGANDATALAAGAVMTLTKWLQLKTTTSPNPICNTTPTTLGNTSTVTTSFLSNSASEAIAVGNLTRVIGLPVVWGPTTLGSLSGQQGTIQASGTATALFTSNGTGGTATVNTQVDNVPAGEVSPSRASITVNTLSTPPTGATGTTTICYNTSTTLTVSGGFKGTAAVTQWYSGPCGTGLVNTGDVFITPALTTTTTYFVRYSGTCNTTTCATVVVTVNDVTGGTVVADQTICSGGDPALFTQSVASTGSGALTYQWQSGTTSCAAGFSNIAGATGTTYDAPTGLAVTTFYRRVTTSTLNEVPCTANSNCITVTINPVIVVTNPGVTTATNGTPFNQTFTQTGAIGGATFTLNSGSLPNGLSLSAAGVLSGIPAAPAATYPMTIKVTDGNGCTGIGATYNLVVSGPLTPIMSSSLRDALLVDVNSNTVANPGDQLRYTTVIRNTGVVDANGVNLNLAPPTNTTENPNSRSTSALARDDAFTAIANNVFNSGNVITNDFGMNAGVASISVVSFGTTASLGTTTAAGSVGTTNQGGVLTVNANGTFSYNPPAAFTGTDQFMYIATTGVAGLPNNDAVVTITVIPDITFSTTPVNPPCNGASTGSITFTGVSGGSGPVYTYSITGAGGTYQASNVFNGLAAATYNPAVKDGTGNIKTAAAIILTNPPLISFTHVDVNNTCAGASAGSITFTASGGTGALTYSITGAGGTYFASPSFTGLAGGTYNLAVKDANGCIVTGSATLTDPPAITFTFTKTDVTCFGAANGSIVFNAPSGGTGPYTYSITGTGGTFQASNSFTGLVPNTYTLVVKDATGCNSATQSTTVAEPAVLVATASGTNVSCNGGNDGTATVNTTGGTPGFTYLWAPGGQTTQSISGLAAGTYTVTVTDSKGCTAQSSYTVTEPPLLTIAVTGFVHLTNACVNNGTITVTVGGGTPNYQYAVDAGAYSAATASTTFTYTGLGSGLHTLFVKDSKGCIKSTMFTLTEPLNTNLSLGSDIDNNLFVNNGDTRIIVYNISEVNGKTASPVVLRVNKPSGYNILFNPADVTVTIGFPGTTYALDNANWTRADFAGYSEFTRNAPLPCLNIKYLKISLQRATPNMTLFNLTAVLFPATTEIDFSSNTNSITFIGN